MSAPAPPDGMAERGPEPDARDHLVPLADGWSLWRWIWLRGAGFPAELVLRLATERSAETAAEIVALERKEAETRARAQAACEEALGSARGADSALLARLARALRAGQAPAGDLLAAEVALPLAELTAVASRLAEHRARLDEQLASEGSAARAAMQELVRAGPMREALVWQNRRFVRGTADAFLRRSPDTSDSKMREYQRVLATYVQRYSVKNETIGFFGPVGWARFTPAPGLRLRPHADLLARRTVYFEHWAVDALAACIAADPAIRAHLAPRRMPIVRVEGETLFYGVDESAALPVAFARVLAACSGEVSAADLAARLAGDPSADLESGEDVMQVLEELAEKGLVTWTAEVPTGVARPERALREVLLRIPDESARAAALEPLDRLEAARDRVAAAAGDAGRLDGALEELEAEFSQLTGAEASRRAGRTYAGRGLVFEDCCRAGEVELGGDILRALGAPLELLLHCARWYTHEIGRRYAALFRAVHAELAAETGDERVSLLAFRGRLDPHFHAGPGSLTPIVREVVAELHARWADLLRAGTGERRITRSASALRPAVLEAFAAPRPGWPNARYQSPDVMLAARDAAAVAAGDFTLVLGEIHTGVNTLLTNVALQQHPDPLELVRAREADRREVGVSPVEARDNATRADIMPVARRDLHVEIGVTRSPYARDHVLAIADLVVEPAGDGLVVGSRDRTHRFDVVAFFDQDLTFVSSGGFRILGGAAHTPRVTIDRLVIARERWRFAGQDLAFARASTPRDRFVAAQGWREAHSLPRFLFAKVAEEPKPLYVDLSSSSYVEILARWARSAVVEVSEMVPDHESCWLVDAAGQRYTSELRMTAVDPHEWRPA
jgi:hypothetical protein